MPTVIFEHRNDRVVWMFEPADANNGHTEYISYECAWSDFHADTIDFLRSSSDNLFIVDADKPIIIDAATPREFVAPCLLWSTTVFICPPDRIHYHGFSKHAHMICMGPASADSLVAAAPYMTAPTKRVSEADVRARVAKVGPLPRRIFSEVHYNESLANIKLAFANTKNVRLAADVLLAGRLAYEKTVNSGIEPLSTIFMLTPAADGRVAQPVFVSDYARSLIRSDLARRVYSSLLSRHPDLGDVLALRTTMEFLTYRFMQSGQWRPKLVPHPSHANLTPTIDRHWWQRR